MVRMQNWSLKVVFTLTLFLAPLGGLGEGTMLESPPGPIWGYFHPAWAPSGYSALEGSELAYLAADPSKRIEAEFQVPQEMRDRVLFWAAVYSRYSSQMKVLHDRKNPSLVYGYLDFTPLFLKYGKMGASIMAERIEREVRDKLETTILSVASLKTSPLGDAHQELFRRYLAWYGVDSKIEIEEAAINLRSQTGQSDIFQIALARSEKLLPHIEKVFRSHNLPKGLSRIPFVESSFNVKARSKIGAMGLWQFVPRTAKEMIHKSDRRQWADPMRQTLAAARLLKRYRRALPDWAATVTSYNSGIGRMSRLLASNDSGIEAIHSTGVDGELGFAGKNFFAEVLAANLVEAYRRELFEKALSADSRQPAAPARDVILRTALSGLQG